MESLQDGEFGVTPSGAKTVDQLLLLTLFQMPPQTVLLCGPALRRLVPAPLP